MLRCFGYSLSIFYELMLQLDGMRSRKQEKELPRVHFVIESHPFPNIVKEGSCNTIIAENLYIFSCNSYALKDNFLKSGLSICQIYINLMILVPLD